MIDKVVYSFSPTNEPAARIASGDVVVLKTKDCFSNQVTCESQLMRDLDLDHINPATGPIYVEGAEPGDALRADILDVKIIGNGVISSIPDCGPLAYRSESRTKIIFFDEKFAEFNGVKFPIDPMIGVIGCTPLEEIPCGWVGDHGGNLDCKLVKAGSSLYCPVFVSGGLFQLGDIHATMGDAELCGTGIESPAEVTVRLTVVKGAALKMPVLETQDKWYVLGNAKEFPETVDKTCCYMQDLLMSAYGWDATDVYIGLYSQSAMCCPS